MSRGSCDSGCPVQSKNLNLIKPLLQTTTHSSILAKSLKHGSIEFSVCVCVCMCLRWAYFQRANTSSYQFNCCATRSFSHSLLTRSETFLHTWLTLPLGSVCGDIIGRRASPFCETFLTFCHPRFFFSSRKLMRDSCVASLVALSAANWNQWIEIVWNLYLVEFFFFCFFF